MKGFKHYSKEEDALILAHWKDMGMSMAYMLPSRTKGSIATRAGILGVYKRGITQDWSEEEIQTLRQHWPQMGIKCAIYLKGRTKSAISCKAKKLELQIVKKPSKPKKQSSIVRRREDKRNARWCFGYIPGGPVRSVFELGSLT